MLRGPNEVFISNNLKFKLLRSNSSLLGFAINKKLGGSVERNKFKRVCRAFFIELFQNKPFVYLVVFPQKPLNKIQNVREGFLKLKMFVENA